MPPTKTNNKPGTKKADRVGIRVMQDGRRARYFKSNGEVVDV